MYEMEIDMKFKNPDLSGEDLGKLMVPELKKSKAFNVLGLSPIPMSPRNSGHALKIISALEANPELEGASTTIPQRL
jgi:hypothetical protein